MKKIYWPLLCCLFSLQFAFAQSETQLIDQQVWSPFQKAYREGDAKLYNSLHTDDVLRITANGIRKGEEYKSQIEQAFASPNRTARSIEFVFEHRLIEGNIAYEVGYYKVVFTQSEMVSVGRFHVVLRKEDGRWRIAQDWDTDEVNGHQVTEADFERLLKE